MKKILLFLTLIGCISITASFAQLAAGDIAIIGYNTDAPDGFSFITLKDIPANEVIYFTDQGWNDNTNFTVTGGGSVILTTGDTGFSMSGGDQIIAYQAAMAKPASAVDITFIAAINGDDGQSGTTGNNVITSWNITPFTSTSIGISALPPGLTNGTDAVALFPFPSEQDNAKYTGSLTGTSTALRTSINNRNNWTFDNNNNLTITPSDYTGVSVTCIAPNTLPTFTALAGVVETTNEDTGVEITFAEIAAQGND